MSVWLGDYWCLCLRLARDYLRNPLTTCHLPLTRYELMNIHGKYLSRTERGYLKLTFTIRPAQNNTLYDVADFWKFQPLAKHLKTKDNVRCSSKKVNTIHLQILWKYAWSEIWNQRENLPWTSPGISKLVRHLNLSWKLPGDFKIVILNLK